MIAPSGTKDLEEYELMRGTCGSCEHSIPLSQNVCLKRWKGGGWDYALAVWCPWLQEFRATDDRILFSDCKHYFAPKEDGEDA